MPQVQELLTVREVAEAVGVDSSIVRYWLKSRITPTGRRGRSPLYSPDAVAKVRHLLDIRKELRSA